MEGGINMATIGQPLVQPEEGWKRYDDTSAFKYIGAWTRTSTVTGNYQSTSSNISVAGNKIKFSFYGTKIRLLASYHQGGSKSVEISIDGTSEVFNQYHSSSTVMRQALMYEKSQLEEGFHEVEIVSGANMTELDAIDIDSTGRLLHPDEVTDIKDLEIGKRIRCHYQATTANTVGTFSNLGQETSDFIPVTSSNLPNGDFYFICVDDENKKKKLIADRNIHTISWDALNSAGIASGSGLPVNLNLSSGYSTTIRLLTGGINNTDKDNEWDRSIVSATLNGSIVAGDNNVWNWSRIYSWMSNTSATSESATRTIRGNGSVSLNTASSSYNFQGFRPVLIIEDTLKTHTLIKSNNTYKSFKNNQWNNISTSLPSQSIFISDGMQNLAVLDRKETRFMQEMSNNGVLGEGKVFKSSVDLKKLFEITKIEVE